MVNSVPYEPGADGLLPHLGHRSTLSVSDLPWGGGSAGWDGATTLRAVDQSGDDEAEADALATAANEYAEKWAALDARAAEQITGFCSRTPPEESPKETMRYVGRSATAATATAAPTIKS